MRHILRHFITRERADTTVRELLSYCAHTDTGNLMLFTSSYDLEPSFLPLEDYRSYAALMTKWIDTFHEHKIQVGINVMQTLGHIYYPEDNERTFGFRRRLQADGTPSGAGACPADAELQKYTGEVYKIFAALHPDYLYVDDDFRYHLDGTVYCFCPEHLSLFSAQMGESVDRQTLTRVLLDPCHPHHFAYREAFQIIQSRVLTDFAHSIRRSVDEVNPDCPIGLMTMGVPGGWWGVDFESITHALAGKKHAPLIRPQIGVYQESTLHDLPQTAHQPAIVRQTLPAHTRIHPEIESYPYTTWSKSAAFTRLQMLIVHLDGMHDLALNLFNIPNMPLAASQPVIDMNAASKEYFTALEKAIPEGARSTGVSIPVSPAGIIKHRPKKYPYKAEMLSGDLGGYNFMTKLGLPIGFDWTSSPFVFLAGDSIDGFSDKDLTSFLAKGALLDLDAFEVLERRGLAADIPIEITESIGIDSSGIEMYFLDQFSGESGEQCWPIRFSVFEDGWARKLTVSETARDHKVLSVLENYRGDTITPLVICVENQQGVRFGIMSFSLAQTTDFMMLNAYRKQQIERVFHYIASGALPVSCGNMAYVAPFCHRLSDDVMLLGLVNASTDDHQTITLKVDAPVKSLEVLEHDGTWSALNARIENSTVEFQRLLPACDVLVIKLYQ